MHTQSSVVSFAEKLCALESRKGNIYVLPEMFTPAGPAVLRDFALVAGIRIQDEKFYESYPALYAWLNENAA